MLALAPTDAVRWFTELDAESMVRLQALAIAVLIFLLLCSLGLSAFLWYGWVLSRESFYELRANYREKMNLRAVETLAREDERKKRWLKLTHPPGSRTSWSPPSAVPDSLFDPLPPPPSMAMSTAPRETPPPDTQRSQGVKEAVDAVASTPRPSPRPPSLPDAPSSSTPGPSPRKSVDWRDLEKVSAKPSALDWRDSRLKTTQLPQLFPLLEREKQLSQRLPTPPPKGPPRPKKR